MNQEGAELAAG